jgi:hypothetical protein
MAKDPKQPSRFSLRAELARLGRISERINQDLPSREWFEKLRQGLPAAERFKQLRTGTRLPNMGALAEPSAVEPPPAKPPGEGQSPAVRRAIAALHALYPPTGDPGRITRKKILIAVNKHLQQRDAVSLRTLERALRIIRCRSA